MYYQSDHYGLAEEGYLNSSVAMAAALGQFAEPQPTQSSDSLQPASMRKLPAISIPTFSGVFSDWLEFKDLFSAIVVKDTRISSVEKLQHLKTHVQGEAAELLKTVKVTDANFEVAWKLLEDHYSNTRRLVSAFTQDLLNVPSVKSESAAELKVLLNSTINSLSALTQLNRPTASWDDLLIALTTRKLDAKTFKEWEVLNSHSKTPPTFDSLKTFLEERISTLEIITSMLKLPKQMANSRSTFAHVATTSEKCFCCSAEHFILRCPDFQSKSIEERRQFVKDKSLCFNCLGNHRVANCRSTKTCQKCNAQHHTLLHEESVTSSHLATVAVPSSFADDHDIRCHFLPPLHSSSQILLPTVLVRLQRADGTYYTARALLDSGSQKSLVATSLLSKLGLSAKRGKIDTVIGVGKSSSLPVHGEVQLKVSSRFTGKTQLALNALAISYISRHVVARHQPVEAWGHLKGLQLADDFRESPAEIELLLGADVYGHILEEGLRIGPPGFPTAQLTIFGWTLFGPLGRNSSTSSTMQF